MPILVWSAGTCYVAGCEVGQLSCCISNYAKLHPFSADISDPEDILEAPNTHPPSHGTLLSCSKLESTEASERQRISEARVFRSSRASSKLESSGALQSVSDSRVLRSFRASFSYEPGGMLPRKIQLSYVKLKRQATEIGVEDLNSGGKF